MHNQTGDRPHRGRLLLGEDDPVVSTAVRHLLEAHGIGVEVEPDGHRVMERISSGRPDALLLDVWLPGRSGIEILRELHHNGALRRLPVTIMSSDSSSAMVSQAVDLGAFDYLVKPFTSAELRERAGRLLDRAIRLTRLSA